MKAICLSVLTCGFLGAVASSQSLDSVLTDHYRDKVLALRHSFTSRAQGYADDGAPTQASEEGPWTLYGRMVVRKITVESQQLKLEGKRALYFFDGGGNLVQFKDDRKHPAENLTITLRLGQPLTSSDDAAAVLGRVFALTPETILDSAPAYWRPLLAKQLGLAGPVKPGSQDDAGGETRESGSEKVWPLAEFLKDKTRFRAPKLVYHVEPAYTEAARSRKLQGVVGLNVVVDNTGRVRNVRIIRPLGLGLDDSAVATVSDWRFEPGTKDGQPVAVSVFVEADFHLY